RESVLYQSTNEAIMANETILSQARLTRSKQDTWQPPESVAVSAIVGTGRNTISGFWYEVFSEQICDESLNGCDVVDIYKPIPIISQRGDQTVMVTSAEGLSLNSDTFYVDLNLIGDITEEEFIHRNFTESPTVQLLIESLLVATATEQQFVSTAEPVYDDQQLLLGTHSPVYFYIEDAAGRQTGQLDAETVVVEIPDTEWFTHAQSSYIVTPQKTDFTLYINSFGTGAMTFTSHVIASDSQTLQHKVPVTTLTEDTVVTISYNGNTFTPLAVDENGDGERDYQVGLDGERIEEPIEQVTYAIVRAYLSDNVRRAIARPLNKLLRLAERFSEQPSPFGLVIEQILLDRFAQSLTWLYHKGRISETDYTVLLQYVEQLQN
ncbi:MAG TPA: hypothetical protein VKP88_06785, partial [Candidatus Paceibacterota bacterium]|nr:hypothetical protein [Candidatus Paceibacterota bacterium]